MEIPRREFLRLLGMAAGATGVAGCDRIWSVPDRLVSLASQGPGLKSEVVTACGLCETGCGLAVRLVDGLPVGLKGNPQHPVSRGGLCPLGHASLDVLYAPERLQGPLRRGEDGRHHPTTWEDALSELSNLISSIQGTGNGDRIVWLNGDPGQLLDDLSRHFMAAIGSPNYARPLDPALNAFRFTQGLDRAPGFDLGRTDLVLSIGQDLFEEGPAPIFAISSMIGEHPDDERPELIHVGTRVSPTASKADLRVAVNPGTQGAFALGVAQVLVREGSYDEAFVAEHTFGFEDTALAGGENRTGFRRYLAERYYPNRVAQICGCEPGEVVEVARRFGAARRPLALAGGEVLRETNATWSLMAVHGLNALKGSFNRPGGVVPSPRIPLTPLPAPPGGGGERGESLFSARAGGGFTVGDPLDALTEGVLTGSHPVDLLFVLGWDPLFDHPSGGRLAEALRRIPTVVSFAPFLDETATVSDITLPASLFMESWVCTTTPSTVPFGTVGIGGPVVEPLFDTRNPGDVILELARRVGSGSSALAAWPTYDSYLRHRLEGLAMVGQGSLFEGALEESWVRYLENRGWRFVEHDDFEGFWADMVRQGGWWNPTIPESAWPQVFPTPSGKFEFWSLTLEESLRGIGEEQESADSTPGEALVRGMEIIGIEAEPDEACFPRHQEPMSSGEGDLRLMTFRPITSRGPLGVTSAMHLEMFGHTLLSGWETWGEVAPETAEALGMGDGDIIRFETDLDGAQLVLRIRPGCVTGVVQVPIGLGHEGEMGPGTGVGTNPLRLLLPLRDPMTGAAALNGTMGRVQLVRRRPHGQPPPSYQGHAS